MINSPFPTYDDDVDWNEFRFPPRPSKSVRTVKHSAPIQMERSPAWAVPPKEVTTWHLDMERLLIIHPVQKKKIDLRRINTRRRLIQLCQLIKGQPNDEDVAGLWRALDEACSLAWSLSLPEMLALASEKWQWPEEDSFSENDE